MRRYRTLTGGGFAPAVSMGENGGVAVPTRAAGELGHHRTPPRGPLATALRRERRHRLGQRLEALGLGDLSHIPISYEQPRRRLLHGSFITHVGFSYGW